MDKEKSTDTNNIEKKIKIGIVGGGAAGMMAAIIASRQGADVVLFEKKDRLGKKLRITGKGRCNVTNLCSANEFIQNVPTNARFLYSAIHSFGPEDTMSFFEAEGVPLKVERGNRVFPVSDRADDIVCALSSCLIKEGVCIRHEQVTRISTENGRLLGLETKKAFYFFDRVILATGGFSYPTTGSDGDGYRMSQAIGLTVTPIYPSLVPLETMEKWCPALQGLSLKNIGMKAWEGEQLVYDDFGEMMFTHFGITGPMVLSLSSHLRNITPGKYKVELDLKPALDEKTLDKRLLSDFSKYANRNFSNALSDLLPSKLISVFVSLSGISPERKVHTITKPEREKIICLLKHLKMTIKRARPIAEAIITSGGVDVREISPKTMECKKIAGLYIAGELLDVDAYTGGFNLQIAFSTAYAAASAAAKSLL
jgi:hypothetical protein